MGAARSHPPAEALSPARHVFRGAPQGPSGRTAKSTTNFPQERYLLLRVPLGAREILLRSLPPEEATRSAQAFAGFPRVAQVLPAASHGHISVLRQRALCASLAPSAYLRILRKNANLVPSRPSAQEALCFAFRFPSMTTERLRKLLEFFPKCFHFFNTLY